MLPNSSSTQYPHTLPSTCTHIPYPCYQPLHLPSTHTSCPVHVLTYPIHVTYLFIYPVPTHPAQYMYSHTLSMLPTSSSTQYPHTLPSTCTHIPYPCYLPLHLPSTHTPCPVHVLTYPTHVTYLFIYPVPTHPAQYMYSHTLSMLPNSSSTQYPHTLPSTCTHIPYPCYLPLHLPSTHTGCPVHVLTYPTHVT